MWAVCDRINKTFESFGVMCHANITVQGLILHFRLRSGKIIAKKMVM
jgi:hypothetical protein